MNTDDSENFSQVILQDSTSQWLASLQEEATAHENQLRHAASCLREAFPAVFLYAIEIWANEADAIEWLTQPHSELSSETPMLVLMKPGGEDRVMNLLAALDHSFPV